VVTLRLFGPPLVRGVDGVEIRLRSRKQLGVLVYLIVERDRAVSRDELIDAFWGDVPHERAYQSLCQALVEIRRAIGRAGVESRGDAIRIAIPTSTDVEVLAQDLERRDLAHPLQDMEWWGTAALGHWLERSRAWVNRMARDVLLQGIAENRRAGATLRVHRCAELLYELDPLSEPAAFALTERELLKGDVVAGIRFLRAHAGRVAGTLGCQPQPEIERLLRRLEAGAHPPIELVPKRLAAHAAQVRPTILVGRERELAFLEGEWQRVREERRLRTCVVQGPAGIGKSSLVRRFAATVASRAQPVFMVSCQEIGERIPFAATADLVEELLRDPAVSATDPVWLAEVSRIHPGVRQQYPGVPEPLDVPAETIRLRIAEGLMRMIEVITEGAPTAVIFDDTAFMDPASRDVVTVFTRRASALPVLVVLVARPAGLYAGRPAGWGTVSPHASPDTARGDRVIELEPLSPQSVFDLVSALDPSLVVEQPAVVRRVGDLSEGNPHFVELLVLDWQQHRMGSLAAGEGVGRFPNRWTPPESLRLAFVRMYDDLPMASRQLLDLISAARRGLEPDAIARMLAVTPPELDAAILSLLSRGIVRFVSGALCVKNELHRAYVYNAIPTEVRRFYHVKLGNDLEVSSRDSPDTWACLEAAAHFLMAEDTEPALRLVLDHAPRAIESGGHAEAEYVIQALVGKVGDAPFAPQLRLLLAKSMTVQGRYAHALAALDHIGGREVPASVAALASALRAQALQRTRIGGEQAILRQCRGALESATQVQDEGALALAVQVALEAASEMSDDDLLHATRLHLHSLTIEAKTTAARGRALSAEGFCAMEVGEFRKALSAFQDASKWLREGRLESDLAKSLNGQGICSMAIGSHSSALEAFTESLSIASRLRDSEHMSTVLGNLGLAHEERGSWDEAWDAYQQATELAKASGSPRRVALALANAAQLAIVRGAIGLARSQLMEAREAADQSSLGQMQSLVHLTQADLHLALGEPELAWICVSDADLVRTGRSRAIDNNGKYLRLRLHRTLALEGDAGLALELSRLPDNLNGCRASDRLEVECFVAWYRLHSVGDEGAARAALDSAIKLRLPGVLGILMAVGTSPTDFIRELRGVSPLSAFNQMQMLARCGQATGTEPLPPP
jgi:DNA-binding SARP family transcriptional activator/tetratricopeptide (TPR) repeat protein